MSVEPALVKFSGVDGEARSNLQVPEKEPVTNTVASAAMIAVGTSAPDPPAVAAFRMSPVDENLITKMSDIPRDESVKEPMVTLPEKEPATHILPLPSLETAVA